MQLKVFHIKIYNTNNLRPHKYVITITLCLLHILLNFHLAFNVIQNSISNFGIFIDFRVFTHYFFNLIISYIIHLASTLYNLFYICHVFYDVVNTRIVWVRPC